MGLHGECSVHGSWNRAVPNLHNCLSSGVGMLLGLCPLCKASASCLGWRVECPAHVHPQWVAGGRPCSEPPPWGLVSTKDGGAGTLAFGKGSPPAFASGVACAWPLPRPCSPPRLPRGPRADWGGQAEVGLLTFLLSGELLAAQGEEVQGARQRLRRGWGRLGRRPALPS